MNDEILKKCDKKQKNFGLHRSVVEVLDVSGCPTAYFVLDYRRFEKAYRSRLRR